LAKTGGDKMDKQPHRLSIKINGKERVNTDDHKVEAKKSVNSNEVAAAKEKEEFEWVLPEENNEASTKIVPIEDLRKPSKNKSTVKSFSLHKKQFPIKKLFLAIMLAVIVGTGFGVVLLQLITNPTPASEEGPSSMFGEEDPASLPLNQDSKKKLTNNQAEGQKTLSIPSLTVTLVQGGTFKNEENRNAFAENIRTSGFASTILDESVFIGVATDEEAAKSIGGVYEKSGQPFHVKQVTIEGKTISMDGDIDSKYVEQTHALFLKLVALSSQTLSGETTSANDWEETKNLYKKVKAKDVKNESYEKFIESLKESYAALQSNHNKQDEKLIWKSQQALLDAFVFYHQWINEISG
jgi:stage II sporulation protein B